MDENKNITDKELQKQRKQQEDLIKLMHVIDECMENLDNFYFFVKTREMLTLSKDN